ncbi:ATP-dependent Clp protease proteolytic subunit [Empedobacter brevis]|uniref:Clp protease ClpP n=1 Tax=Empedobacter brevis TaxID=247 RepID=UPI0039B0A0CB
MNFNIKNNIIHAYGDINEGDGVSFVSHLEPLEKKHQNIIIQLHTNGGSVFDGNIIYNAIVNSKSTIAIHIVGIAASMGAVICLATEEVYMVENGYLMIHAPSSGSFGTAKDHDKAMKLLQLIESNFIKKLIAKTGQSQEYVSKWLSGDNWFNAEQALTENLIKGIIEPVTNATALFNPKYKNNIDVYKKITASLNNNLQNKSDMNLKSNLIETFNLKNVTESSSDTAILNEIKEQTDIIPNLIELLGLDETATSQDIVNRVKELLEQSETSKKEQEQEAENLIDDALRAGKISHNQRTHLKKLFASNYTEAKSFLNNIAPRVSIYNQIMANQTKEERPKSEWTLDDYRKNDPKALANNPSLYKELINKQFNNK